MERLVGEVAVLLLVEEAVLAVAITVVDDACACFMILFSWEWIQ